MNLHDELTAILNREISRYPYAKVVNILAAIEPVIRKRIDQAVQLKPGVKVQVTSGMYEGHWQLW